MQRPRTDPHNKRICRSRQCTPPAHSHAFPSSPRPPHPTNSLSSLAPSAVLYKARASSIRPQPARPTLLHQTEPPRRTLHITTRRYSESSGPRLPPPPFSPQNPSPRGPVAIWPPCPIRPRVPAQSAACSAPVHRRAVPSAPPCPALRRLTRQERSPHPLLASDSLLHPEDALPEPPHSSFFLRRPLSHTMSHSSLRNSPLTAPFRASSLRLTPPRKPCRYTPH